MLTNKPVLTVKIGERTYELSCGKDAPLGELHDAIQQFKAWTINRMQEIFKQEQDAAEKMIKDEAAIPQKEKVDEKTDKS